MQHAAASTSLKNASSSNTAVPVRFYGKKRTLAATGWCKAEQLLAVWFAHTRLASLLLPWMAFRSSGHQKSTWHLAKLHSEGLACPFLPLLPALCVWINKHTHTQAQCVMHISLQTTVKSGQFALYSYKPRILSLLLMSPIHRAVFQKHTCEAKVS